MESLYDCLRRFTENSDVVDAGTTILRISMLTFYACVLIPILMRALTPPELGIWWGAFICVWSGALLTIVYGLFIWRRLTREIFAPDPTL